MQESSGGKRISVNDLVIKVSFLSVNILVAIIQQLLLHAQVLMAILRIVNKFAHLIPSSYYTCLAG